MREAELERTLILLSEDKSASEHEREQALRALKSLRNRGTRTIVLDTILPLSEVVGVADVLGCATMSSGDDIMIHGDRDAVRAVEVVCQVSSTVGMAREVALGILPYVTIRKHAIVDSDVKVKRVRAKRTSDINDNVVLPTLIALALNRLKDSNDEKHRVGNGYQHPHAEGPLHS